MIEPSIVKKYFCRIERVSLSGKEAKVEAKVADGVRCPYCGASRIHREGYTGEGDAKYSIIVSLPELRQIFQ